MRRIHIGDIVLARNYGILGWLIRKITGTKYNHVCIYVGNGTLVDTDFFGIRYRAYRAYKSIPHKIVRVKKIDYKITHRVCKYARSLVCKRYSLKRLFRLADDLDRYTCSHLVNECYAQYGITLSSKGAKCTPADIEKSKRVVVVKKEKGRIRVS